MNEQELQVLRNITREHMRLLSFTYGHDDAEVREVTCVQAALRVMKEHDFKQDRPL